MNKRGFTLVELLAVITIIGLIGVLTSIGVSSIIKGSKKDMDSINIDTVLNAAYDYSQKDLSALPKRIDQDTGEKICVNILVKCGLLKDSITSELKSFSESYFQITYYETKPEKTKEHSKFYGNYLITYGTGASDTCPDTCPYINS